MVAILLPGFAPCRLVEKEVLFLEGPEKAEVVEEPEAGVDVGNAWELV